jgi:hypothetical protein
METNPKTNPDLSAEVASLKKQVRRQMARRKLEIDSLKEQLKVSKSFSQLRIDYERKIGTGKLLLWLVPAIFSVILAVFGWAGYKKLSDFERRIESRLVRETESNIELSRAFTYLSARRFESAIDILNKAFELTLEPWSKVHQWRFFRIWLRKNPRSEPVVQKMWDESRNTLNKMQNGG